MIGLDLNLLLVGGDGFLQLALAPKQEAQVIPGILMVGGDLPLLPVGGDGVVGFALAMKGPRRSCACSMARCDPAERNAAVSAASV
jgi:hypothetical protein